MVNKKLTKILLLIVTFSFILNILYILIEINHRCEGENCPICYLLKRIKVSLDGIEVSKLPIILISFFIFLISNIKNHFLFYFNKKRKTLIGLKVRLNN